MTAYYWVAQRQPDTDEIEVLWQCTSYRQAQDECDRMNSNLAAAGIPGEYYGFVLQ